MWPYRGHQLEQPRFSAKRVFGVRNAGKARVYESVNDAITGVWITELFHLKVNAFRVTVAMQKSRIAFRPFTPCF